MVKINDLLDMSLREVLEKYCMVDNLECGYVYGVAEYDLVEDLYNEYDIESYAEAFSVDGLISDEVIVSYDDEVLGRDKLERILKNLGIQKK